MIKKPLKFLKGPLFNLLPVFLGVILALYFENLNESRTDKNKINALLSKIELGTQKNIENLEFQLNQNQKVRDALQSHLSDSKTRIGDIVGNAGGIRYIQFDLAAWNVLKNSELLVDVDYDIVSLLYLLNESIIYDSGTIKFSDVTTKKEVKEEVVSSLEDYLISINYRLSLCNQIKNLLNKKE
ncbi:MAG: hypothetical protein AAGH81_15105 [Bacteroidota bacterium]